MTHAVSNTKTSDCSTLVRAAVTSSLFLISGAVHAGVTLGAGIEYFSWREYDDLNHTDLLDETGPRAVALAELSVPLGTSMDLLARGKVYGGEVDYDGALNDEAQTPWTTTTEYLGAVMEGGLAFRPQRSEEGVTTAVVLTLGFDTWTRDLTGTYGYEEEYDVTFLRLGMESEEKHWKARGGLLLPLDVDESVEGELDLKPDPNPWFYVGVGYRVTRQIELALDYQGYRFDNSDPVYVDTTGDGMADAYVYQPRSDQDTVAMTLRLNF